jgi:hypothetical protein
MGTPIRAQKPAISTPPEYKSLQARAAALERTLLLGRRSEDGRICFVMGHQGQSHYFSHLHDVHGHLNALEAAR